MLEWGWKSGNIWIGNLGSISEGENPPRFRDSVGLQFSRRKHHYTFSTQVQTTKVKSSIIIIIIWLNLKKKKKYPPNAI